MQQQADSLSRRLDEAQARLDELGRQVMAAGEDLHETEFALAQTEQQMQDTQAAFAVKEGELADAREVLAQRVAANYRSGGVSFLNIIADSSSFEEFASSVYYADKIAEQDASAIRNVQDIQSDLEDEQRTLELLRAEQEQLAEQQREQVGSLQALTEEQAAYVNSLDQELRDKLEEKRQAELSQQRAAAETAAAALAAQDVPSAAQAPAAPPAATPPEQQADDGAEPPTPEEPAAGDAAPTEGEAAPTNAGLSSDVRATILNAAFSQIGVPYVFGGEEPGVGLDCSGFTQYCYAQAGIVLPHSAAAQADATTSCSYDALEPGDLIFWIGTGDPTLTGNHVAMYIGDGRIIHAVWTGVKTQDLYGGYTKFGKVI